MERGIAMKVVVLDDGRPTTAETAQRVRDHGHEVAVVSAPTGGDNLTEADLVDTLTGCSVVIDFSGPPSLDDGTLTEDDGLVIDEEALVARRGRATAALLAAEAAVGVEHHVSLHVVGVDRARAEGAFRALRAQEEMIRRSGIPYSIVRATQLFESAAEIAAATTEDWIVWVPPVRGRPSPGHCGQRNCTERDARHTSHLRRSRLPICAQVSTSQRASRTRFRSSSNPARPYF
jgi:hypothetical protein